jgi:pilus assembly protein CpaF
MSLRERLAHADADNNGSVAQHAASETSRSEIVRSLHFLVIEEMGEEIDGADHPAAVRLRIERRLRALLAEESTPLSTADRNEIIQSVVDNIMGYGPIEPFLQDPTITEIMVNNPETIYVEREGRLTLTDAHFIDDSHLMRIIDKIAGEVGRRVDESSPMVDARLPDGSRVNAIIHPLALNGPILTVRKFSHDPFMTEDLIRFGTLSPQLADFLRAVVLGKLNVLISGGTGTGKTTLLNVVSQYVPEDERIVTIEDSAELRLHQEHVLRLESRPPNIEGRGEITVRDLLRNALRMRPDRIIVGEVRGAESLDMLQAMNTGHEGSLSTIHANSPRDALARLETMVLMAGFDLPMSAIRQQGSSAIDVLVHLTRLRDGTRRVTHVTEVEGMEGDTIVLQDIFYFDYSAGLGPDGRFLGRLKSTGLRPKFARRLEDVGVTMPSETFEYEPPEKR